MRAMHQADVSWRSGWLVLIAAIISGCGEETRPAAPLTEIEVVEVIKRDQSIHAELIGETRGASDIPIRARVEGVLTGMHFVEGASVDEGDPLYTIDPSPYETMVIEAEGQLAEALTRV